MSTTLNIQQSNFLINIIQQMQVYITSKQNQKLLKVFLLKTSYELVKSLDKQTTANLISSCIIIRRQKIKNQTQFGYKEQLKTGALKKIHFIYLPELTDLIEFLWVHCRQPKPLIGGIMIDSINQYFGERFNFNENGRNIGICMNLLLELSNKLLLSSKKINLKIGFSFCFNSHIFPYEDFYNFMRSYEVTVWQLLPHSIKKNKEEYESQWTNKFIEIYGGAIVKQQQ